MTFIDDEGIRALVALEMKLSGNWVTPTMHGEYYYKKPPLFNWILLFFFELTGRIDEFTARLPTVLALLGYGATIFYFTRRHFSDRLAFLNALLLITCGRMLFWDSMLALIDTTFSWVIFTLFMVVFNEHEKERYWRLFLLTYLLTALGFLLKGLPAIVFQGITLLAYFTYRRQFRRLFLPAHFAGIFLFLLIVGGYYLLYHQYNDLENVFVTLFRESSKRTVVKFGFWETVLHFFTFPFEMTYHFMPWSLLIIYFFRRDILKLILAERFATFCVLTFLANIIIYWISPEVYPRYLLMLAPLIFTVFVYLHERHVREKSWQHQFFRALFFFLVTGLALVSWWPLFWSRVSWIPYLELKAVSIGLAAVGLWFLYWRWKAERLLIMVAALLVVRVAFNWMVLPDRNADDYGNLARVTSKAIGREFRDEPLFLFRDVILQSTNSFYLTNERRKIIPRKKDNFDPEAIYIIPSYRPREKFPDFRVLSTLRMRHYRINRDIGRLVAGKSTPSSGDGQGNK